MIRLATEQDLPAIMAIETRAHLSAWPEAIMRGYLKRQNCVWVLEAEQQGAPQIVAYAVNTLIAGEAELLMIAVAPEQQRRGYGRKLLSKLEEMLLEQGAEQWFLDVRASNFKARNLYEDLGFNMAGRRRNYYPAEHGREDAMIYCMSFTL